MEIVYLSPEILFLFISIPSLLISLFLIFYPQKTIEFQKAFYALINWRMEPISMEKEIRSTRIMGIMVLVFIILVGLYIFLIH